MRIDLLAAGCLRVLACHCVQPLMKGTRGRVGCALALSTKIIFTVLSTSPWQMTVINQQPESPPRMSSKKNGRKRWIQSMCLILYLCKEEMQTHLTMLLQIKMKDIHLLPLKEILDSYLCCAYCNVQNRIELKLKKWEGEWENQVNQVLKKRDLEKVKGQVGE